MSDVTVVSTNNAPDITAVLTKDDGSGPLDLTGASVKFQMRQVDARRFTVNATASIVGAPTNGQVSYSWAANDLNVPGHYAARWTVTFPGGRTQSSDPPNLVEVARL